MSEGSAVVVCQGRHDQSPDDAFASGAAEPSADCGLIHAPVCRQLLNRLAKFVVTHGNVHQVADGTLIAISGALHQPLPLLVHVRASIHK
uniref:Uncharacterized protein n=1 Tax=uncultured marine microorganism HF4000_137B17 TaxID=455523 RepID=B3T260_9ZZZZ|nr:hypothetical protein ALOHA_HF4000137B17ctg1g6 [uncultured marine microorganism HF4000_137B17]